VAAAALRGGLLRCRLRCLLGDLLGCGSAPPGLPLATGNAVDLYRYLGN